MKRDSVAASYDYLRARRTQPTLTPRPPSGPSVGVGTSALAWAYNQELVPARESFRQGLPPGCADLAAVLAAPPQSADPGRVACASRLVERVRTIVADNYTADYILIAEQAALAHLVALTGVERSSPLAPPGPFEDASARRGLAFTHLSRGPFSCLRDPSGGGGPLARRLRAGSQPVANRSHFGGPYGARASGLL